MDKQQKDYIDEQPGEIAVSYYNPQTDRYIGIKDTLIMHAASTMKGGHGFPARLIGISEKARPCGIVGNPSALSQKYKELIALGISINNSCYG